MQLDIDNHISKPRVPLLAIPFDLGQLGHRAEYARGDLWQSGWIGPAAAGAMLE